MKEKKFIQIPVTERPYITLGHLLKHIDIISSGGMAKQYLAENAVLVNDKAEQRRGRKLYVGDCIVFAQEELIVILVEREN